MNEAIDMAKLLHQSPDLFPWVVLAIILFVLYKERETVKELVQSIIQSRKETAIYHAQHNELVRNNTAALENNTAMLEIMKQDRNAIISMLEKHEDLSAERDSHIQTVVNRIDRTVNVNQQNLAIIADRTDK